MIDPNVAALIICMLLGGIHYLGDKVQIRKGTNQYRIISFAAGLSIGYLFIELLPMTYEAAHQLKDYVFVFLLLGFTAVHLAEKYFYQHHADERLRSRLSYVHFSTFFFYYFLVGCIVADLVHSSISSGILFVLPVALHAGLSSASLSDIHGHFKGSTAAKVLLAMAAPAGVLLVIFVGFPQSVHNVAVSGVSGILLYIYVKEFLPEKEMGQPLFFLLGLSLFFGVMVLFRGLLT